MKKKIIITLSFQMLLYSLLISSSSRGATRLTQPKLILVIVIDQFRTDYLTRFGSRFLPVKSKKNAWGGFQYLISKGAYFPIGQYDILQSMTAPGHATILTGSYPYLAGIPLNGWIESSTFQAIDCTDDSRFPVVGVDPKNKIGVSPEYLAGTTVGDEIKNAGFPSQVVSIALKERSSVLLGGHRANLAIWYNTQHNKWISSEYYLPNKSLPQWLDKQNEKIKTRIGAQTTWNSQSNPTGYSEKEPLKLVRADDEHALKENHFPHTVVFGKAGFLSTPIGLEMTEDLAEKAFDELQLGQKNDKGPDLLAVSFSSFDLTGHDFGPNSLEMEEMTVAMDRVLSKFFNHIHKKISGGIEGVTIVLTGDHGIPPSPEWAQANRIKAGRIDVQELSYSLNQHLEQKFGSSGKLPWVVSTAFNFYINRQALESRKQNLHVVEKEVQYFLKMNTPEAAFVFTSGDYEARKLPPGMLERQILHTYYPGRSGDVIVIPKPFYIFGGKHMLTTTHLTGYTYDKTVPILFAGPRIKPGLYGSMILVNDIAPTLSFLAGGWGGTVLPPSLSEGKVLTEILYERLK